MVDRVQRVLDGELPREALEASERAELEAYEEALDSALARVRAESAPDVSGRVMARIVALPRHRSREPAWRQALGWLWSPRPVTIRPAWALAAAALAGLLLVTAIDRGPGVPGPAAPATPVAGEAPVDGRVFVHFRLDAAGASSVKLAADFTGWEPRYTLSQTLPGVWTVVVPVESGVHQYGFVVDGERWVPDPLAPQVDDGFGGTNSRLDVVRPEPRSAL
ncbi:MAG TPA: glycogen-binding domain-containing protein [Longimicrobiales bacterium]|nr:glycogen-binding domain-containing protein [Longimicrobiales bacterium]